MKISKKHLRLPAAKRRVLHSATAWYLVHALFKKLMNSWGSCSSLGRCDGFCCSVMIVQIVDESLGFPKTRDETPKHVLELQSGFGTKHDCGKLFGSASIGYQVNMDVHFRDMIGKLFGSSSKHGRSYR